MTSYAAGNLFGRQRLTIDVDVLENIQLIMDATERDAFISFNWNVYDVVGTNVGLKRRRNASIHVISDISSVRFRKISPRERLSFVSRLSLMLKLYYKLGEEKYEKLRSEIFENKETIYKDYDEVFGKISVYLNNISDELLKEECGKFKMGIDKVEKANEYANKEG